MTLTSRLSSVTLPVADQDRAVRFHVDQLGFEVRSDLEFAPGVRLVEGAPPMFSFSDPDGNGLVFVQEPSADDAQRGPASPGA